MRINVAGAGAGKTTKMADYITEFEIPTGKIVGTVKSYAQI